jgi:hypothetical protein
MKEKKSRVELRVEKGEENSFVVFQVVYRKFSSSLWNSLYVVCELSKVALNCFMLYVMFLERIDLTCHPRIIAFISWLAQHRHSKNTSRNWVNI